MSQAKSNRSQPSKEDSRCSYKRSVVVLILGLSFCLLLVLGFRKNGVTFFRKNNDFHRSNLLEIKDRSMIDIYIDQVVLQVEVVNTPDSRSQGLSNRTEIGADGMLFVFPETKRHSLWMRQMKFDLDFIWLNKGKVVDTTDDVPAPDQDMDESELVIYQPNQRVDMVLEVETNFLEDNQIEIGDVVRYQLS